MKRCRICKKESRRIFVFVRSFLDGTAQEQYPDACEDCLCEMIKHAKKEREDGMLAATP